MLDAQFLHQLKSAPDELLILELNNRIQCFLKSPTRENKEKVLTFCIALTVKEFSKGASASELMREINEIHAIKSRLNSLS